MVDNGFWPKQHWIWSNECTSQFKNKTPWYFVSWYPYIISGCVCLWNFFGSSHGKGLHNGVGIVLKWFIWQVQLDVHGPNLQNAIDVVDLLHNHLSSRPKFSYSKERRIINRHFWHVKLEDVDRLTKYTCETVKGIRDILLARLVSSGDVDKLMKKNLACF